MNIQEQQIAIAADYDQINDGGPAFPVPSLAVGSGMTLRDYFAAAIMQGLMASQCEVTDDPYPIYAYRIADAMLKARDSQ